MVEVLTWSKPFKALAARFAEVYTKYFYNKCEMIFVPYRDLAEELAEMGFTAKKAVMRLGVDSNQFKPPKSKAEAKAKAKGEYEKQLAITIIKLKNGLITEFEGQEIPLNMPGNLIEKIAKGICWKESIAMDEAEAKYKALITDIDAIKSQLNGWQSINRHLDRG